MIRSLLSHHHSHHRHRSTTFHRSFFFFSSSKPNPNTSKPRPKTKVPLLFQPQNPSSDSTTLQLLSWGRGSSGQLGSGTEELRLYPSPFASLQLPPSFRLASPISGRLNTSPPPPKIKNAEKVGIFADDSPEEFVGIGDKEVLGIENGENGILSDGHGSVIRNESKVGISSAASPSVIKNESKVGIFTDTSSSGIENGIENEGGLGDVEVGISCGLFHCALMVDGKVWMWGKGDGGRLGFGDEHCVFEPTLNPNLESMKSVALGGLHSAALTSQGQVLTWGYGGFGALGHSVYTRELTPRLVEGPWKDEICHISTSGTHTAAITSSGELYTWGREEGDGRLGLGPGRGPDQAGGLSVPTRVEALPVPVSAVSCGGFFTMALTEDGQLWNWGANSNYELGRGNRKGGWKPQAVPGLEDVRIIQIVAGGYHSLALTDEGKVLSWGHGGHGQLGNYSLKNQMIPTLVEALAGENVVYIACGGSSCAAVTDNGKLYMWGNSKDNQLGVPGLPDLQLHPIEVNFLMESDGLGSHNVLQVAVGASHAMCLVSRSRSTN